jgi:RHS repeat-associated protein
VSISALVASLRYKPFGEVRWSSGALPTNRKFGGKIDDGFGLLNFEARMYSPLLGRFVSADTIVPGAGNPQKHMDADRHPRTILIRRRRCAGEEGGRQHDNDLRWRTL